MAMEIESPRRPTQSVSSAPASTKGHALALWITYFNIVLYALCYQLQKPVEPFLVKQLSKNAQDADSVAKKYGQLQSLFSTIQTFGSPLVGILLDRVGIRKASAMVFLSSAASYAILAAASSMDLLFYSKIPTALQHAFLVAQATAATSTAGDDSARAQALGRMTTAYTIGATIGPYLGGQLAETGDLYIGAKLAVMGSLFSALFSLMFLPNSIQHDEEGSQKPKRPFVEELRHSAALVVRSTLWPLLTVKVIGGMAASMHATAVPLVLTQQLQFDPAALGFSMSTVMLCVAAFGGVGMAPLTRLLGAAGMTQMGLVSRALLGMTLAGVVSMASYKETVQMQVMTTNILHGIASHALATGLTTQTTGAVDPEEQGALLGLEHGLFSLARIAGPALGTFLLSNGVYGKGHNGFWSVASVCGSIDVVLLSLLIMKASQIRTTQKSKSK